MHDYLVEWLLCPNCRGDLSWREDERDGVHIEAGRACCKNCNAAYPIREGIGLFLLPDLPRDDLWQNVDNGLISLLNSNPEIEGQLMGVPLESLGPADQFFRAMVLEERGELNLAAEAENMARQGLYTPEYRACSDRQVEHVLELIQRQQGAVVDLASGRGHLVGRLADLKDRLVVATDFSPKVLRRNRRWLKYTRRYDRVSLLGFDARRTPFRDGAVPIMTTYVGLPNIESPGELLVELRRIVGGDFVAVSQFYPPDDVTNVQALEQAGLETLLLKGSTLNSFASSGWRVEIANSCHGRARPTPTGKVIKGAGIDGYPVAETDLEWCVLIAS